MKKLVLVVTLMIGLGVIAQRPDHEKKHRGDIKDMSPEQIAGMQTKRMTLALDLSEAQQSQIQSILLDNAIIRVEKMKEREAKKENGEFKKPTSEQRYAMKTAMLDRQIAQKEQLKKILDKEQYDKWEKMKIRREGHRKGKEMQHHAKKPQGK